MKRLFLFLIAFHTFAATANSQYSRISEYEATNTFGFEEDEIFIHHQIKNEKRDKIEYSLWCRGGSDRHLDDMSEKLEINMVGWIACRFYYGDVETELTLIPQDVEGPYWFGPGVFDRVEILQNEGLGSKRSFTFRNIDLVLDFSNIDTERELIHFQLSVTNSK